MQYVEKIFDGVQWALSINAATFSGAIDVIVIEQPDGSLRTSPFHVRWDDHSVLLHSSREAR
jgi:phosphatidate phosphatase LPIN